MSETGANPGQATLQTAQQPAQQSPRDMYNKAVTLEQQGNPEAAIAHYRFCIAVDPTQAQALFKLGNLLITQNKARESLPYFKVLTLLNPDYVPARINFAIAYKKVGKLDEAIVQLEAASVAEPDHLIVWQQLADGYRTAGNLEKSLSAYEKWVALDPHDAKPGHMVEALKARMDTAYQAPARASDAYVASYFDQYAGTFDSHTASVLRYQA
jgi:predicted Zn-dependent protease